MSSVDDIVRDIFDGVRRAFSRGYSAAHDGWDIPAPVGTAVYAVKGGTVRYARDARIQGDRGASGWAIGGGNVVDIDVGNSIWTQYAHLSRIVVREGQLVQKGQLVGYVGKTGGVRKNGTTGPGDEFVGAHLHFGAWDRKANRMVKPETVLDVGDTSGALDETLKKFGIPTGDTHVITPDEATKLASTYPEIARDKMAKIFTGKTVGWLRANSDSVINTTDPAGDIGNALGFDKLAAALGELGNVATKVVAYTLAVVLIVLGVWLYSKSASPPPAEVIGATADLS